MDVLNGELINEGCPTRETWIDFCLGKPDFAAQDALLEHLEVCPQCQATLADLGDVRDEVIDGLRQPLEDDPRLREPALLRLTARLAVLDPSLPPGIDRDSFSQAGFGSLPLERLGRYQFLEELGRGGFGVVYLAFDTQLKQKVALKMPRDRSLLSPAGNHAFAWEGRAAAGLDHPHILRIYDAGEIDGIPYIASAYCAGPTLARWLKDRAVPIPVRMAADLVVALANAVQHAHGRGVLHRDLKPSNILLSPRTDGDPGTDIDGFRFVPKITDFGLAKVLAKGMTDPDHAPTETGAILGTPSYMAPEQASGRSREADIRTDVYGLGALLYHLLTSHPPFRTETPLETLKKVANDDPVPLAMRRPSLPRDLETICLKCLAKSPDRRYASAGQLAEDLCRHLEGKPIQARPVGWPERAWKWAKRRPVWAVSLVASPAIVLLFIVLQLVHRHRLQVALDQAERSDRSARNHLYVSNLRLAWSAWQRGDTAQFREILDQGRPETGGVKDDSRGFEWYFLRGLADPLQLEGEGTLHAHTRGVACVRYAPDGSLLASSGFDGLIKFWDPATGLLLRTLTGHTGDVNMLSFSPDGRTLASAGDDGTVRIWEAATGEALRVLDPTAGRVFEVAFSPDGRFLASGGEMNLCVFDRLYRDSKHLIPYIQVKALAFSRNRPWLVASTYENCCAFWRMPGVPEHRFDPRPEHTTEPMHSSTINELVAGPKGPGLISASSDGSIRIFNSELKMAVSTIRGHLDAVSTVSITPDSLILASGSKDATVRLWHRDGRQLVVLRDHIGRVNSVTFSPDGRTLASAGDDGTLRLWNWRGRIERSTAQAPLLTTETSPRELGEFVALSPDGKRLAVAAQTDGISIHDFPSGRELFRLRSDANDEPTGQAERVAFSPDGHWLAAPENDGHVWVWDLDRRERRLLVRVGEAESVRAIFAPNGRFLVVSDSSQGTWLHDWPSGRQRIHLGPRSVGSGRAALSSDSGWIATVDSKRTVSLWDAITGQRTEILVPPGPLQTVYDLAFSPDNAILVTTQFDRTIHLWDTASGRLRSTLRGHARLVHRVRFTPDGKTLLSLGQDGVVTFWQTATWQRVLTWDGLQSEAITCAVFTPDQQSLILGVRRSYDGLGAVIVLAAPR